MKGLIMLFFISNTLFAFDKLLDDYCVYYGNRDAPVTITQFFSFACPHCVALFRKEFNQLKENYIDQGHICLIFHPVPMDLLTVQGMECLKALESREKKIFLEAILEELIINKPKISATFMQKAMELLDKPIPKLQEMDYLETTSAFNDAFLFLKQEDILTAVPSMEVNGTFYEGKVPEIVLIEEMVQKIKEGVL